MDIFEAVRGIAALDAAQRLGWPLRRSGSKWWARCPLHGEKTASLCFYGEGTWYCFGCHRGGDAVRLYQEYYQLPPYDAAVRLAADFGIAVPDSREVPKAPRPTVYDLTRALERRRSREWSRLCDAIHRANAILAKYDSPTDAAWDSKEFITALRGRSCAEARLDWLWQASLVELVEEYKGGDGADGDAG